MYIKYITYLYVVLYVYFYTYIKEQAQILIFLCKVYILHALYMYFYIFFYNSNQFKTKHNGILKKFTKDKFKIEYFILLIGIN